MARHRLRILCMGQPETFTAGSQKEFAREFLAAYLRAVQWHANQAQTEQDSALPHLEMQRWDEWYSTKYSDELWVICSTPEDTVPEFSAQCVFKDSGAGLWTAVEHTAKKCEQLAKFFGYYPNSENQLEAIYHATVSTDDSGTKPDSAPSGEQ